MPDPSQKENRKQLLQELKRKAKAQFENSLPMKRELFLKLFDYLSEQLDEKECDNGSTLTNTFLLENKIENVQQVLEWLAENGGYCDCEILANVEQMFE